MSYDFNGLMLRKIKWFWRIFFFCLFQRKVYSIFWLLRVFGWAGRTNKKFSHLCYCLFSTYCFHSLKKSPKDCIIHLLSNKLRKNSYHVTNRLHILLSYIEKKKIRICVSWRKKREDNAASTLGFRGLTSNTLFQYNGKQLNFGQTKQGTMVRVWDRCWTCHSALPA